MNKFFNFFHIELLSLKSRYSFFFVGPAHHTPESFKEICDKNLPAASLKAVAMLNNSPIEEYCSISMVDIIEQLEESLEFEGFTKIQLKTVNYSGSRGRVSDEDADQLGVAKDTIIYHSSCLMQEYEWDEETGDRRTYY